jgi:hypothetical protein
VTYADRMVPVPPAPEVERELAVDMLRRGVWAVPGVLVVATLIWGTDGAASGAVAIALVAVNLMLAAIGLSWAAKRSFNTIMAVSLLGFAVRMGLLTAVLFAVRHASWIDFTALGILVLVTHLGLLFWEMRYVSASLAFPGLKPTSNKEVIDS